MPSRLWISPLTLALVLATVPAAAQPPEAAPLSRLDLVRGLRDAGMPDLALEYLRESEGKPLSDEDRKAIPMERAKCLLDAADEEPDEGTRASMVGEAKEAFDEFLLKNPKHPRAAEASLSLARLTSLEAKAQLQRARRTEIPAADGPEKDEAVKKQREEAVRSRPLFLLASKRFAAAAQQMKAKLADPATEPGIKQSLGRAAFDADLAAAVNQYHLADTFLATDAKETIERAKFLDDARDGFAKLSKGPPTSRTVWVARAWMAETLMDQGKPNEGEAEFKTILGTNTLEAEDGKRLVRFFQIRRAYLDTLRDRTAGKLQASERELRAWLAKYGAGRRPNPEVISARYYHAFTLQLLGEIAVGPPPKDGKPQVVGATARRQLEDSEKLYRALSQTDNDYTARATRNRMTVVRKLLGEADRATTDYTTFEAAQMAALIQIAKLGDAEQAVPAAAAKIAKAAEAGKAFQAIAAEANRRRAAAAAVDRKARVLELLEHARELATPQDNPGDVADTLLRLVYFYQTSNQPHQAAVLGEHVARTVRIAGGKASVAGVMAVAGYTTAAANVQLQDSEAQAAARRIDLDRAIRMARFVDEKFPNDTATDAARHRLAGLLSDDGRLDQAFETVTKIRAGYANLTGARQLEGYIASQIITAQAKDVPMPPGGKPAVYHRAVADLSRVVKPGPDADADDVRGYVSVRARLAQLYLSQSLADPEAEKVGPGYDKALAAADELAAAIPAFSSLNTIDGGAKKTNLDGTELKFLALDIKIRALYLKAKALIDAGNLTAAAATIDPAVAEIAKAGPQLDEQIRQWVGGQGDTGDPEDVAAQKGKIATLASGIDKTRREVVSLGFKLRLKESKVAEASAALDLLDKLGGGVEANQPTLELMARELAAQIPGLKKAGKTADAKALADGLSILLKRLAGVPNLTVSSILFIGQTLLLVEQYDDALKEFAKIAPPSRADWQTADASKIPDLTERKKLQDEVKNYRFAQLYTAKCLRGTGKLAEAEALLSAAVGTADKQGYAYAGLDFRKELGALYEAKGAAATEPKAANVEWSKALKEWTTLFQVAQGRIGRLTPETPVAQVRQSKSAFFDAYFEVQRVVIAANTQVFKDNPAGLAKTHERVGKAIADMEATNKFAELETKGEGIITPDVWSRYCDLLDQHPDLKKAYAAAGGKFFLERPKE